MKLPTLEMVTDNIYKTMKPPKFIDNIMNFDSFINCQN